MEQTKALMQKSKLISEKMEQQQEELKKGGADGLISKWRWNGGGFNLSIIDSKQSCSTWMIGTYFNYWYFKILKEGKC